MITMRILGTITAIGLIIAAVAAVLYFMALPIFDEIALAWTFFYGLIAAAVAIAAFAVKAIWEGQS